MNTAQPILEVSNLAKDFGEIRALSNVSFNIQRGQVLGFIGANGAGKTTTMRIIATLEQPTMGLIKIAGYDVVNFPRQVRNFIGWMPDAYGRYSRVTVFEYLDFYARAYGYRSSERTKRVQEVMDFVDLNPLRDRDTDALSKGMAQRLCLGRMLLHDPALLLMDEPAAGLDPKARVEFKHLVRLLAKSNKAVLISSHILSELEDMCDSILFINGGEIAHHGSTESLKQSNSKQIIVNIRVAENVDGFVGWIALQPGIEVLERLKDGCRVAFETNDPAMISATLKRMLVEGFLVLDFHRQERRLEEAFIDFLEDSESKVESKNSGEQ